MENKAEVKEVTVSGDQVLITMAFDKQDLLNARWIAAGIREDLLKKISEVVSAEILEKNKDEIIKQVLLDVNWAEIVRSDVAKKILQNLAREY